MVDGSMRCHAFATCFILALVCTSFLAGRPDGDDELEAVQVVGSGHFIKRTHHHHHHRHRHGLTVNTERNQPKLPEARAHQTREQQTSAVGKHSPQENPIPSIAEESLQEQPEEAGEAGDAKEAEDAEAVSSEAHLQKDAQEIFAQELKSQWENAKHQFYIDAAVDHEDKGHDAAVDHENKGRHVWRIGGGGEYAWSDFLRYWTYRLGFVGCAIYLMRTTFTGLSSEDSALAEKQHALSKDADKQSVVWFSAPPGDAPCETDAGKQIAGYAALSRDKRLGKAIDERLCQVERRLRHDMESEAASQAHLDEQSSAITPPPAESDEEIVQTLQM